MFLFSLLTQQKTKMMFSGSIVSTSANLPPWQRKESVTIIERADEDEKDAEDEPEVDLIKKPEMDPISCYRRASSAGEQSEDHFLTVPKSMTASSSAETLTGNILLTL
jgi:hypothetical protein